MTPTRIHYLHPSMKVHTFSLKLALSILISLMLSPPCGAQETISGTVFDGQTERPLSNAYVRMGERNTKTDVRGEFNLPFDADEELEVGNHSFHEFRIRPSDLVRTTDLVIYLTPKPESGGIRRSGNTEEVYTPDFEYIFDFHFIDNKLVIATYFDKKINKSKRNPGYENCVLSLFEKGEIKDRLILPNYPYRLRKTPFGELFLEGADYAKRIRLENGKLISREVDYQDFITQIIPLTAAVDSTVFWVKMVPELPQVVHYGFSVGMERALAVRVVRNEDYFERVETDYSMLDLNMLEEAKELAENYGFNEKLFAPFLRSRRIAVNLTKPYSPGFAVGDDYLIFDALNHWVFSHGASGEVRDSVYLPLNLDGEDLVEILQDPVSESIYAVHEKSGIHFLRLIDPYRGSMGVAFKIDIPFPEKLRVFNGNVFYINRDVDRGMRHLYSEKLDFLRNQ